jgi:hypothetical protein
VGTSSGNNIPNQEWDTSWVDGASIMSKVVMYSMTSDLVCPKNNNLKSSMSDKRPKYVVFGLSK